jgi:phage terminase large subunit
MGEPASKELKVYKDWGIVDEIPHEAKLERFGLDFGYTNDPSAIIAIYYFNGGYILDEICYQKGLSNRQIADIIKQQEQQAIVIADSAEPKSIDEIMMYGLTVLPTEKGQDSVRNGISVVQAQRVSITKRSLNLKKEYDNYLWMTDKNGKILDKPEHEYSHAMDALRYGLTSIVKTSKGTAAQIKQTEQFSIRKNQIINNSTR